MCIDNNIQAFLALTRAGLWEKDIRLSADEPFDLMAVQKLAKEQSVAGLVAAGLEHVLDFKLPKDDALHLVGQALLIERQNRAMNEFIGIIEEKMLKAGINALLVKGQGIAQCYENPLWRACGDVDFLLSNDDYEKAKKILQPLAKSVETERSYRMHFSIAIDSWVVELHGTLRTGLSSKIDKVIDETQRAVIFGGNVRPWMNGGLQVFLPGADSDVLFIFTHFLKHFYKGGIGLRQICDWCRLLWTYKGLLNHGLLESRIQRMGLVSEWKAFGAFAVDYLGMPSEAMPLYSSDKKWSRKADKICAFIMEVGNFGHNRDNGYYAKYPFLIRKIYSFGRRCGDLVHHARIFPMDSLRFFPYMMYNGLKAALSGEKKKYVQEV